MKNIFFSFTIFIITTGAYAQVDTTRNTGSESNKHYKQYSNQLNHPDGYMFQNGRVVMVKNGKITMLDKDVTLSNGMVIMSNGNYMQKGGMQTALRENQHIDMAGNIMLMDKAPVLGYNQEKKYADGYLYRDGRVLSVKNGVMTLIDKDITLSNGTVIMSNGNYMVKGGKKVMMREGEHVDMNGKATFNKDFSKYDEKSRDKNMYLINDTTKNKHN